jgi:hypothetical protein
MKAIIKEQQMSWLDKLAKQFPNARLVKRSPLKTGPNKNPRENLLKLLQNSLSYLNDANFTVAGRNGKTTKPAVCYNLNNGVAEVTLRYSKQILDLDGNGQDTLKTDQASLKDLIGLLTEAVNDGTFDKQLAAIKAERSKQHKNARLKKAA